jgi:very-short-patch-repair endonuclease
MKEYIEIFSLNENKQLSLLTDMHHEQNLSFKQMADRCGTYPNKLKRLGKKLGLETRTRSEAQKNALDTGTIQHPTKGKERSEETKIKISDSVAVVWKELEPEEKERRRLQSKELFDSRTEVEKKDFHDKAGKAIRKTAKTGSKLEEAIFAHIVKLGYRVKKHQDHILINQKLHLDIYIPELKTAIEIDGPSHYLPIWGADALRKTQLADNQKDGMVLNSGCCMVRIRQQKNLSKSFIREVSRELTVALTEIKKQFPKAGNRYFKLGAY